MDLIESIPVFDKDTNNKTRTGLLKHCATNFVAMLKAKDCNLSADELQNIENAIADQSENKDYDDVRERLKKKME